MRYRYIFTFILFILILTSCANNRPTVIVITSTFPPSSEDTLIPSTAVVTQDASDELDEVAILPTLTPMVLATAPEDQYVVQPGDTLSEIAYANNASLTAIMNLNGIQNPNLIEVGQVIFIPGPPTSQTPNHKILPDSHLVRSQSASNFDLRNFVISQNGFISKVTDTVTTRLDNGFGLEEILDATTIIERISLEYSIDPRVFLTFLEYQGNWLSNSNISNDLQSNPLVGGSSRSGLYQQLRWLGNVLNQGYYDWKYRGVKIIEFVDGTRQLYNNELNAGTVAIQYALAMIQPVDQWQYDVSNRGFSDTYRQYFGDPFASEIQVKPDNLIQPVLNLPFVKGDVWRFTGGFHGGWDTGSAWAALDFAPPDDRQNGDPFCYISEYSITAVADGIVSQILRGMIILDLDDDGLETTGWSIVYLHMKIADTITVGQKVSNGDTLGYASCQGGFSTATHLHIARRFNGEWIPADCANCSTPDLAPSFVMGDWKAVGLRNQQYQGYMINLLNNQRVVAEQGRNVKINEISW